MRTFAMLLLLSVPFVARAESASRWIEVHNEHFNVFSNGDENEARDAVAHLECMRSVFEAILPNAAYDADQPIIVLLLKDRKAFDAVSPASYAKDTLTAGGYFLRMPDQNFIVLRTDQESEYPYAGIYHEYIHFILRKAGWIPLWLNEGLAQYYENTIVEKKDVLVGVASADRLFFLKQRLGQLMPLSQLLRVQTSSREYHDASAGALFYTESWALTHLIVTTDKMNNTHRLQDYAKLLSEQMDPVSAAQQAFGDLKKLEQQLNQYIFQTRFEFTKLTGPILVDESLLATEPVSTEKADEVRIALLMNEGRIEDAAKLAKPYMADDSNDVYIILLRSQLQSDAKDEPGAMASLDRAKALAPSNFLVNYAYGYIHLEANDLSPEVEDSLKSTVKSAPNFAQGYDTLVRFYLARNEHLDEAYPLSLHAVQLDPQNMQFRMDSAEIFVKEYRVDNALRILQTALQAAKSSNDKKRISDWIEKLRGYEKQYPPAGMP